MIDRGLRGGGGGRGEACLFYSLFPRCMLSVHKSICGTEIKYELFKTLSSAQTCNIKILQRAMIDPTELLLKRLNQYQYMHLNSST